MEEGAGNEHETAAARAPPALPWSVRIQLFFLVAAAGVTMRSDGKVNRSFFNFVDRRARASARPDKSGVRSADVDVDAARGLRARVFSPPSEAAGAQPLPVIVYFHGGAFALLSAASAPYDAMCRRLCRDLHAVVVSVDYRLAPENRCPAAYDDGVDVLRHPPRLRRPPRRRRCSGGLLPLLPRRGQRRRQHRAPCGAALDDGQRRRRRLVPASLQPHPPRRHHPAAAVLWRRGADGGGAEAGRQGAGGEHAGLGLGVEGVPAGGRRPGPPGRARDRRERRPAGGVPAGDGGDRWARPAAGLAAAVRRRVAEEWECGAGGRVPRGHPHLLLVPRAPRLRQARHGDEGVH